MVIFAASTVHQKRRRNYNVPQSNMRGVMRYFRLTLMYVWGIELEKLSGIAENNSQFVHKCTQKQHFDLFFIYLSILKRLIIV